jgi:hypothetical protein
MTLFLFLLSFTLSETLLDILITDIHDEQLEALRRTLNLMNNPLSAVGNGSSSSRSCSLSANY